MTSPISKQANQEELSLLKNDRIDPLTENQSPIVEVDSLSFYYGNFQAVNNVSMSTIPNTVTAFIGPSGCGKSTLLRCFNRMNDLVDNVRLEGDIKIDGSQIYGGNIKITDLRKKVGMVFQKSNPFPKSIYDNVAFGPRLHGIKKLEELDKVVEESLKSVALWEEVSGRLDNNALQLSGGQQQRLCIARAIAIEPDILLMDEPCSALDPIATSKIEELIFKLKKKYTIIIVTHNMQQAARVSDMTGFLLNGEMVEFSKTTKIFQTPSDSRTEDYIRGRFG